MMKSKKLLVEKRNLNIKLINIHHQIMILMERAA